MADGGSSRRAGKEGKSKTEAYAELVQQRRAGKRVGLTEEWKDEEDVYDVLEEGQYADVVAKRREEGGQLFHLCNMHGQPLKPAMPKAGCRLRHS